MLARLKSFEPEFLPCALVAAVATALVFLAQAHIGLAPQEEGYLWYGVDAFARGEWPIRDFRSYDPGRYVWCAAWSPVFGGGILGLRAACALFACIGLTAGLLVARRVLPSRAWLAPIAVLIALWQFPGWRPFESSLSLVATYCAMRLFQGSSARTAFACGVFTGIAAIFGRNHGLYAGVALVLVLAMGFRAGNREHIARRIVALLLGTLVGYAPMFALIVLVPGFGTAFVDSILFFVGRDGLNIPHAATWPWTIDYERLQGIELVSTVALSIVFIAYVVVYAFGVIAATLGRLGPIARSPALVAAVCVGLPYVHHVAERSDIHHVAESVHPMLLSALALAAAFGPRAVRVVSVTMLALSALSIGTEQPIGRRFLARGSERAHVAFDAGGTELSIDGLVARRLESVRAHVTSKVPPDAKLLLSTKLLVLYPILGRSSPVWDVYPSWVADTQLHQRMLDELSSVDWIFLQDVAVGGAAERRLASTYPGVWQRMQQDFDRIPTPELPENFVFLHRR